MAQEVQTTLDYRAELNEIEGIWYQQRKVSDKMQVRDKKTNEVLALADSTPIRLSSWEVEISWWTLTSKWGVEYTSDGAAIIIPEAWPYLIEYQTSDNYTQTNYFYTARVKVDGVTMYSIRLALGDRWIKTGTLNLGKKNKVTVTLEAEFSSLSNIYPTLKIIKL